MDGSIFNKKIDKLLNKMATTNNIKFIGCHLNYTNFSIEL